MFHASSSEIEARHSRVKEDMRLSGARRACPSQLIVRIVKYHGLGQQVARMIAGRKFRASLWWVVTAVLGIIALPGLVDPNAQNLMYAGAWLLFATGIMLGTLMDRFAMKSRVVLSIAVLSASCSTLLVLLAWWLGLTAVQIPQPIATVPVVLYPILAIALIHDLIRARAFVTDR